MTRATLHDATPLGDFKSMPYSKLAAIAAAVAATCGSGAAIAQSEAPQAHVYATVGYEKIKPELVLDSVTGEVTGTYTATQSEAQLNEIYYTGTYGITSGTLEGIFSGNTLTGYWYEPAFNAGLQGSCEELRKGTLVYGRFTLTFSPDRKSFTGLRTGCDIEPDAYEHSYNTWNGTLLRRQAATASNVTTSNSRTSSVAADKKAPVEGRKARRGAKPTNRISDSAARAAEDEINAKAEEAARRVTRAILDKAL